MASPIATERLPALTAYPAAGSNNPEAERTLQAWTEYGKWGERAKQARTLATADAERKAVQANRPEGMDIVVHFFEMLAEAAVHETPEDGGGEDGLQQELFRVEAARALMVKGLLLRRNNDLPGAIMAYRASEQYFRFTLASNRRCKDFSDKNRQNTRDHMNRCLGTVLMNLGHALSLVEAYQAAVNATNEAEEYIWGEPSFDAHPAVAPEMPKNIQMFNLWENRCHYNMFIKTQASFEEAAQDVARALRMIELYRHGASKEPTQVRDAYVQFFGKLVDTHSEGLDAIRAALPDKLQAEFDAELAFSRLMWERKRAAKAAEASSGVLPTTGSGYTASEDKPVETETMV